MMGKPEERCSDEIRQRLRKYDIVEPLARQKEVEDLIGNVETNYNKENVEHSGNVIAMSVLEKIFSDNKRDGFYLFEAMCGVYIKPEYIDESVPEFIRSSYQRTMDNLSIFRKRTWWVYEKDVLRAVAYHDYISNFKIDIDKIVKDIPPYNRESYLNLPIDLKVHEQSNDVCYYVFPEVGGGFLSKAYWHESKNTFKNIFLKKKLEFELSGEYNGGKEKGIKYEILRAGIKDITANSMSLADIWFFKNVFDPELLTSVYLALKDTNMRHYDYKLIWVLGKCKCPSVRIYIFEAIKPCYLYIRKFIKAADNPMDFLLDNLASTVESINNIFQNMVNIASICFHKYATSSEEVIAYQSKLKEVFERGDDFPFVFENNIELAQYPIDPRKNGIESICTCSSNNERVKRKPKNKMDTTKTYYEYMLDVKDSCMDRIAYGVITALNEQWAISAGKKVEMKEFEKESVKFQEGYNSRLSRHLSKNV